MKKTLIISCAALSVSLLGWLWWQHQTTDIQYDFSQTLPPTEIATATRAEQALLRYWAMHSSDPIFALPGIDTTTYDERLVSFKDTVNLLLSYYPEEERDQLLATLYPFDALTQIPNLETSRQAFLVAPSDTTATAYHENLLHILEAYISAIDQLRTVYETQSDITLTTANGRTSVPFIAEQLTKIKQNLLRVQLLEHARYGCWQTAARTCNPDRTTNVTTANIPTETITTPPLTPAETEIYEAFSWYYPNNEAPARPPVVLNDPRCEVSADPVAFYSWSTQSYVSDFSFDRINILRDVYFYDVASLSDQAFFEWMVSLGSTLSIQATNAYRCTDQEYDTALIRTLEHIAAIVTAEPLFTDPDDPLYALEQQIITTPSLLSETEIVAYVHSIHDRLAHTPATTLEQTYGRHTLARMQEITLLWQTKSVHYERQLTRLEDLTRTALDVVPHMEIPPEALYLLRTFVATTYHLPNATLYQKPIYLTAERYPVSVDEVAYRSYQLDLRFTHTLDALLQENEAVRSRMQTERSY